MSTFFRLVSFVCSGLFGAFLVNAMWAYAVLALVGAIAALACADSTREIR